MKEAFVFLLGVIAAMIVVATAGTFPLIAAMAFVAIAAMAFVAAALTFL